MKNTIKRIGAMRSIAIIGFMAVIGFTMAGCGDASSGPTGGGGGGIAPTITTTTLPNGTVGTAYNATLVASGDTPITWSVSPALPAGLSLNASTGAITGTPTAVSNTSYTFTATNTAGSGTKALSIVIAASGSTDTVITIAAIAGVTAPVQGASPVTAITTTAQYTGTVVWTPAVTGTFAYATVYTATITLTPTSGFTLQGVAANFFTVAGTTSATNSANSGVITAVFPATANDPTLNTLSGTITISPNTGVFVDQELSAAYSGNETVSFQWHKDGATVGTASTTNPNKYTPTTAGSYTVIVSATGYNPETSNPVTVHNHPSAAISGSVTVTATKANATGSGAEAANATVTINLTDATVETTLSEDAENWFNPKVAGLNYNASASTTSAITITITGIPTATSSASNVAITIPAGHVKDAYGTATTTPLSVSGNITYNIDEAAAGIVTASAAVSGGPVTATKANFSGTGGAQANATVTITLTHATVHTALTSADVSTWFNPPVAGLSYHATATVDANTITVTITGTPTATSDANATVTIPAGEVNGPDGTPTTAPVTASGHVTYEIGEAANPEITGFDFTATVDLKIDNPNTASGAVVGTFSNVAGGTAGTHTYTLVVGSEGSTTDNASFEIDGNELKVGAAALTEHKTYNVYVQVRDVAGQTFAKECDFTVVAADLSDLDFTPEPNLVIGGHGKGGTDNHGTEANMTIGFVTPVGGTAPYTYELVAGTGDDDNGLFAINADAGHLNVGAANLTESKIYKVFVKVTDSSVPPQSQSSAFTFVVREPPTITTTILDGSPLGRDYGKSITATGDTPITWSIESGALPTGLSLAPTTGLISGRPSKAGESTFVVKATNAAGYDTKSFTIDIIALSEGENAVEVNFTAIADETIDLGIANQLSAGGDLIVTVDGEWESYVWYLDGKVITGETTDEVTIHGSPLKSGAHILTAVVVKKDTTIPYSKVLKFVK